MSVFPEITSVPFGNPVIQQIQFKTLMSGFDDLGKEQRKQKWLYPRRLITLRYNFISKAEVQTLYQFYIARGGAYGAFAFFYPSPRSNDYTYITEYVGTGDASETVFSLPALDSGNYTLYVDGDSQTDPADYSFSAASGPDGEDKVTFTSAPPAGARITFTFTGRLKVRARFKDDKLSVEEFMDRLINVGLQLQGLLNDA
ncbi:unnamed protein product [marine sediment metagenome]|uniref:DUF2460 domain-containing protein n=1 Tax=marine sediment metagenome TaxID=412755 RepID=X0UPT7_9ZZZZ